MSNWIIDVAKNGWSTYFETLFFAWEGCTEESTKVLRHFKIHRFGRKNVFQKDVFIEKERENYFLRC